MKIDQFPPDDLQEAFGADMADIDLDDLKGVAAAWGRVRPGTASHAHQHDEVETFVIVKGSGEVIVDGARHFVSVGTVIRFDPFETHVLENSGDTDIVFATFYWRDAAYSLRHARGGGRTRFGDRPVFVFSTPPTPNGDLHLGHLSGPYLGADVFVRYQRMNGVRAWHLTGSDDFQSYVSARAYKDGATPAEIAGRFSTEIAETLRLLDVEPDQYTVTSASPNYCERLQEFFSRLVKSGWVRPKSAPALFESGSDTYLYEGDVSGSCPHCHTGTSGNICEDCGEPNLVTDLINPSAGKTQQAVRIDEITRFSIPLQEFRESVADHHRLGRVPARLRELAERVFAHGDIELPISHPGSWGVSPREGGIDDEQVIWVWPEMAYGFLYGISALGERLGESWQINTPEDNWKIVHFFGYDNSFYHSILYPVLYQLAFPDWNPDIDYHVNEFYLLEEQKFSTSRQHAVWGKEILEPRTVDAVRFYLARTRPEGMRTNFASAAYHSVVQEVLIDSWQGWLQDLGQRVNERFGGSAPDAGIWTPEHTAFLGVLGDRLAAITSSLNQDGFSLNRTVTELEGLVDDVRRFSAQEEQVSTIRAWGDESRTAIALELAAARLLAHTAAPVMPRFAARLAGALGEQDPSTWPVDVTAPTPGTSIKLADQEFFVSNPISDSRVESCGLVGNPTSEEIGQMLAWLDQALRRLLDLSEETPLSGWTLKEHGMSSLQAVTLQYWVLVDLDLDVPVEELMDRDIDALAELLSGRLHEQEMTA